MSMIARFIPSLAAVGLLSLAIHPVFAQGIPLAVQIERKISERFAPSVPRDKRIAAISDFRLEIAELTEAAMKKSGDHTDLQYLAGISSILERLEDPKLSTPSECDSAILRICAFAGYPDSDPCPIFGNNYEDPVQVTINLLRRACAPDLPKRLQKSAKQPRK